MMRQTLQRLESIRPPNVFYAFCASVMESRSESPWSVMVITLCTSHQQQCLN